MLTRRLWPQLNRNTLGPGHKKNPHMHTTPTGYGATVHLSDTHCALRTMKRVSHFYTQRLRAMRMWGSDRLWTINFGKKIRQTITQWEHRTTVTDEINVHKVCVCVGGWGGLQICCPNFVVSVEKKTCFLTVVNGDKIKNETLTSSR